MKLLTFILILGMSFCLFSVNLSADSATCDALKEAYDRQKSLEYQYCNIEQNRPMCEQTRELLEELNAQGCEEGCSWATDCDPDPGCNPPFYYDQMGNQYHVDNSPYIVWKIFRKGSNEIMFCIEPEQAMNECADYTTTPATLDAETFTKISLAAMFYNESPSNEHYVQLRSMSGVLWGQIEQSMAVVLNLIGQV